MKASILIITFNQSKYIAKAIEGILIQKQLPESEIILCDDCSTDDTVVIASKRLKDLPNVSIHSNADNLGVTKNYQQAFSLCRGEYIFILEGDDYWTDPLKIKTQVDFLDDHPMFSMCAHRYYIQQENTGVFSIPEPQKEEIRVFDTKDLILDSGIISNFTSCCYRKSCLEKISPNIFDIISFDWMVNIAVGHFGLMARINEPMSVYRISRTGVWSGASHLDQLRGIAAMIPEYNRIMAYAYDSYFQKKLNMVNAEIGSLTNPPLPGSPLRLFKKYLSYKWRR